MAATYTYMSFDDDIASVDDDGVITGHKEGSTAIGIMAELETSDPNYEDPEIGIKVTVIHNEN